jgi:hypothetical protein
MTDHTAVDRRNYRANLLEGGLYLAATPFFSPQTVLPVLVAGLGGGNLAVGAVAALNYAGVFLPQAFVASKVAALPWKKPWALALGAAPRSPSPPPPCWPPASGRCSPRRSSRSLLAHARIACRLR